MSAIVFDVNEDPYTKTVKVNGSKWGQMYITRDGLNLKCGEVFPQLDSDDLRKIADQIDELKKQKRR